MDEFYTDKHILLTGVTGFLGKVLLEKILWELHKCLAGVKLTLLVRGSQGSSAERRVNELLECDAFDRLRQRHGKQLYKEIQSSVQILEGDLDQHLFGLDHVKYEALSKDLDVVFHCAALVKWDAPLQESIKSNALGTQRIAELVKGCHDMGRRTRLVLVSTAFVHGMRSGQCAEQSIPEIVRERREQQQGHQTIEVSAADEIDTCFQQAESVEGESKSPNQQQLFMDEAMRRLGPNSETSTLSRMIEEFRTKWVDAKMSAWGSQQARKFGWWDGYTFSKALGETLATETLKNIPFAILRPSGVVAAVNEPVRGWVDAYLVVEPLIEALGKGQLATFPGDPRAVVDCVPVDYVVNAILAAGAFLASSPGPHVYQCASGDLCPYPLEKIEASWRSYFEHEPFQDARGRPVTPPPVSYASDVTDFEYRLRRKYMRPLGVLSQGVRLFPGWSRSETLRNAHGWCEKKRRTVEKVLNLARLYSPYVCNEWIFGTCNTQSLMRALSREDRCRFPYFPESEDGSTAPAGDWHTFWSQRHIPGMRRWVLKDSPHHPQSRL